MTASEGKGYSDNQTCILFAFTDEEYDDELLALANLLSREEAANLTDHSITTTLDDIMQRFQASEAGGNQVRMCRLMGSLKCILLITRMIMVMTMMPMMTMILLLMVTVELHNISFYIELVSI